LISPIAQQIENKDFANLVPLLNQFKDALLKEGEGLCNAMKLLTCNNATNTCGCGDPGTFVLLGETVGRTKFMVQDGNQCRWTPGSYCFPEKFFKQTYGSEIDVDIGCVRGTECIAKEDGTPCTFGTLLTHALNSRGDKLKSFLNDSYSGAICSCQSQPPPVHPIDKDNIGENVQIVQIGDVDASGETDAENYRYSVDGEGDEVRGEEGGGRIKRHVSENDALINILPGLDRLGLVSMTF